MGEQPSPRPPRLALRLLRIVLHPADRDAALSDLDEELEERTRRDGAAAARAWCRAQAWRSVGPALLRRLAPERRRLAAARALWWIWRGLRARRTGALVHVALVAVAVAASAVAFAAADAFVFRPGPYPNADQFVVFQRTSPVGRVETLSRRERDGIEARTDVFRAVYGHGNLNVVAWLSAGDVTDSIRVDDVAPALFGALGVRPAWGRPLVPADADPGAAPVALVGASLARRLYGTPGSAIGRDLPARDDARRIVGVMPDGFRFPTGLEEVWRPLSPSSPGAMPADGSLMVVAELQPGVPIEAAQAAIDAAVDPPRPGRPPVFGAPRAVRLSLARKDSSTYTNTGGFSGDGSGRLFMLLLATALGLALVTCLNVASLGITAALQRSRSQVVQAALGASRGSLVRVALAEGAALTFAGAAAGLLLARWGTAALAAALPRAVDSVLTNPIDVDARAVAFGAGLTLAAWLVSTVPIAWRTGRTNLAEALRHDSHAVTRTPAHARARALLVGGQVAASALLIAVGVLFGRAYAARFTDGRGFDDRGLAFLQVTIPRPSALRPADVARVLRDRLPARPGIAATARGPLLPPAPRTSSQVWLRIDGVPEPVAAIDAFTYSVDPEFFDVAGIPLQSGRSAGPDAADVVIDDAMARRFWPDGTALGARINLGRADAPARDWLHVVGVAATVRAAAGAGSGRTGAGSGPGRAASDVGETGGETFGIYRRLPENSDALGFVLRLRSSEGLGEAAEVARSVAPGAIARTTTIGERDRDVFGDARIAAGVTAAIAGLSFVIAVAGLYAVTAFLTIARTREIGIRLALGADRRDVARLVLGPVALVTTAGAVTGIAAAVAVARWTSSRITDVPELDAATGVGVAAVMIATGLIAAAQPARSAMRIDPADTLRQTGT
ncbi:MAG: ABC transporter permease [Vicinamibacterales bacterium]